MTITEISCGRSGGRTYLILKTMIDSLIPGQKGTVLCPTYERAKHVAKLVKSKFGVRAKPRSYRNLGRPIHVIVDEFSCEPITTAIPNETKTFGCEVWK